MQWYLIVSPASVQSCFSTFSDYCWHQPSATCPLGPGTLGNLQYSWSLAAHTTSYPTRASVLADAEPGSRSSQQIPAEVAGGLRGGAGRRRGHRSQSSWSPGERWVFICVDTAASNSAGLLWLSSVSSCTPSATRSGPSLSEAHHVLTSIPSQCETRPSYNLRGLHLSTRKTNGHLLPNQ